MLGMKAFVCQVCNLYNPQTSGIAISDVYEQSKKILEQAIKEKKLELNIEDIEKDYVVDLSIDEFEEEEEPVEEFTAMNGEVLIVNKKFDFVIINIGKYDGLSPGDNLEVYRNSEFLAKAQVEKLYDRMSAATILPQYTKVAIKPGDQVLIRTELDLR